MFLGKSGGLDYRKFYSNRLIRIVVPYIAWNLIYYLYFVLKGYFPFSLYNRPLYTGETCYPFYFIVVIVQFYALAPLWFLIVKKSNITVVLVLSAVVTFLLHQYLPISFPWFSQVPIFCLTTGY